jgi:hypothetical protein
MIMAPAVEPASSLPRSQSAPSLVALSVPSRHSRPKTAASSANFDVPSFNSEFELDISFSAETSQPPVFSQPQPALPPAAEEEVVARAPRRPTLTRQRTNSLLDRSRAWLPSSKSPKSASSDEQQRPSTGVKETGQADGSPRKPEAKTGDRGLLSAEGFASFARRSWMSSSRSPSPRGRSASVADKSPASEWVESKLSRGRKRTESAADPGASKHPSPGATKPAPKALTRAGSYLRKLKSTNAAALSKQNESDNSCASSTASIPPPGSTSIDTCTSQATSYEENAASNRDSSAEIPDETRDALWSSFKTLDVEFSRSVSKQAGLRVQLLQLQILPFLKGTMNHASTKHLQAVLIDRRATVLGKWWQVILEMMENQAFHPLSVADRSLLLEAAAMIMMRAEWRQTTMRFRPLADRSSASTRARSWTASSSSSLSSGQAAFLAESAEHNVKTTFIANLMRQITFIVDKMSLRHVPANLVNFAAKTCAYAFFFAPGVADILVRLWGLTPQVIRRAADEFGLPRASDADALAMASKFPPAMDGLVWTSSKSMWNTIKQVPQMSLLVARVPWTGPWVSRWKGRDTDLFFIFCKYFYILSEQFMPESFSLQQKAAAPGFVLVQAHLLSTFDNTIHRHTVMDGAFGPPLLDSLNNADASAMALPLPSNNLMKGMSENRLLALLKDFFSDDSITSSRARHTFAEALACMLKAATKKISQYDNAASFTLLELLEELLGIYSDFEAPDGSSYIDWTFWLDVCKRVLSSLNTMSEIRLFSFLYTIWGHATKDPVRKRSLCLDWLLTEDMFHTYFHHWCPMVRAYYQRLLCWRICRDDGVTNEVDAEIWMVVKDRLRTVWGYYHYLKATAEQTGKLPPSTAPMLPSPGKKFMILRQEQNSMQQGMMVGFDTFAKISGKEEPYENPFIENEATARTDNKKRWSIFGKVLSFSGADASSGANEKNSWNDDLQIARKETAEARTRQAPPPLTPKITLFGGNSSAVEFDSMHSPTLLDEPKYVFRFSLSWHQQPMPIRERILQRPVLPRPAHLKLRLQSRSPSPRRPLPDLPPPSRTPSGRDEDGPATEIKGFSPLGSPALGLDLLESLSTEIRGETQAKERGDGATLEHEDDSMLSSSRKPRRDRAVSTTTPVIKPAPAHTKNAIYVGRALAEWGIVVFDCNNFVDRRLEEGVPTLKDVEVPSLSLEGFRKLAG